MALTTIPFDPILDLAPWVGQRSTTFQFRLVNAVTGERLGEIHPIREGTLSHDTTRIIKRQLSIGLGVQDTAAINPITDRIELFMAVNDVEWPLGRYMFTDQTKQVFSSGNLSSVALNDEMFLVDQEITKGINSVGLSVAQTLNALLGELPVEYTLEPSPYTSAGAWGIGQTRGSILESLAVAGDLFSPWFGNDGVMHFIRTFNPANQIPTFDFDAGYKVFREGISETSDLLTAPNRFVVISNAPNNTNNQVVGVADVPQNAPNSFLNRGFIIAQTLDLQLTDGSQALAVAQGLVNRQTIFERTTLTTALDPRHDSYDVILWQGNLWLELAWSMDLVAGGGMTHTIRRGYST
jgi:hypothetical protein